jgi:hypothetical protein
MLFLMASILQIMHSAFSSTYYNVDNCTTTAQSLDLTCTEINSWSEVSNEISSRKCKSPPNFINLCPSAPLVLSNELDISGFSKTNDTSSSNMISLMSLSGIEVYPWPFCPYCVKNYFVVSFSSIKFYVNNKPPGSYNCSPDLIPEDSATTVSFLSTYTSYISIWNGNTYGSLSQTICPYLFKNAQLDQGIDLYCQVESFLFVSLLRFQTDDILMNKTKLTSINSNVAGFWIFNSYNFDLDMGLIHPLVFGSITSLNCYGTIKSIQTNLF